VTVGGRTVTLLNCRRASGEISSVRVAGSRIAAADGVRQRGDVRIDLGGDRVLPGLINAHDHLQLNALPRLKYRDRYENVSQWIADIDPRLEAEPMFVANRAIPKDDRLLIGGVKNLLSGVTTVAHHDPLSPSLVLDSFPVRVVANYGWSHSLHLDGAADVRAAHRATPRGAPWIIHAAEGVDAAAAAELDQLEALGCVTASTVIVHGVALDREQRRRLAGAGAHLVWCPSSNLHLFGRTADVGDLLDLGRVALGTDSRLSGERDLLAELRVARRVLPHLDGRMLESLVTDRAARLLRLPDRGALAPDALADLVVLPADLALADADRSDLKLVVIGGVPRYGDADYIEAWGGPSSYMRVEVDGRPKLLLESLALRLCDSRASEPGLIVPKRRKAIA
jgi:cytosine/adenosine deaminase-related metal-dependent hydrolase